ncbi:hypothetical protein HD806DRAFT_550074 [Xylariaceae sp. AK1471]|nr:hypothetical protein HD806DRAFT_550074 [Xylariaceae sp. AK1471]
MPASITTQTSRVKPQSGSAEHQTKKEKLKAKYKKRRENKKQRKRDAIQQDTVQSDVAQEHDGEQEDIEYEPTAQEDARDGNENSHSENNQDQGQQPILLNDVTLADENVHIRVIIAYHGLAFMLHGTRNELVQHIGTLMWWMYFDGGLDRGQTVYLHQLCINDDDEKIEARLLNTNIDGTFTVPSLGKGRILTYYEFRENILVKEDKFDAKTHCARVMEQYQAKFGDRTPEQQEFDDMQDPALFVDDREAALGRVMGPADEFDRLNPTHDQYPCQLCGSVEHDWTYCQKRSYKNDGCFNCTLKGHDMTKCKVNLVQKCTICTTLGHWRNQCPSLQYPRPDVELRFVNGKNDIRLHHNPKDAEPDLAVIGVLPSPLDADGNEQRNGELIRNQFAQRIDELGLVKSHYVSASFATVLSVSTRSADRANLWRDHTFVATYDDEYVAHLGQRPTYGYRTQVELDNAMYGPSTIRIIHSFCSHGKERGTVFAETYVKATAIKTEPGMGVIPAAKMREFAKERGRDIKTLPTQNAHRFYAVIDTADKSAGFHHVRHLNKLDKLRKKFPGDFDEALSLIDSIFGHGGNILRTDFLVPQLLKELKDAWISFSCKYEVADIDPYRDLKVKCRFPGVVDKLSRVLDNKDAPFKYQEKAQIWMTPSERSVRFAYAVQRELRRSEGISALTERKQFPAIAIPSPIRAPDLTYDVTWLVILIAPRNLSIMPRPGDLVKLAFHDVKFTMHGVRDDRLTYGELVEILHKYLIAAELFSHDLNDYYARQAVMAQALDTIVKTRADDDNTQRDKFIQRHSETLLPAKDEERLKHRERIGSWVNEFSTKALLRLPPDPEPELPLCKATCVSLGPEWNSVGSIGFQVTAPRNPQWRKSWGQSPPVEIHMPTMQVSEKFRKDAYIRQIVREATRPGNKESVVQVSIYQGVLEDTAKAELDAIADTTADPNGKKRYDNMCRWIADFSDENKWTFDAGVFPGLSHMADRFDGKPFHQCAYADTQTSPMQTGGSAQLQCNIHHWLSTSAQPELPVGKVDFQEAMRQQEAELTQTPQDDEFPTRKRSLVTKEQSDHWFNILSSLDNDQRSFVLTGNDDLPHGFKLLVGCPGSGKTTVVAILMALCLFSVVDPKTAIFHQSQEKLALDDVNEQKNDKAKELTPLVKEGQDIKDREKSKFKPPGMDRGRATYGIPGQVSDATEEQHNDQQVAGNGNQLAVPENDGWGAADNGDDGWGARDNEPAGDGMWEQNIYDPNAELEAAVFEQTPQKEDEQMDADALLPQSQLVIIAQNNEQLNDVADTMHETLTRCHPSTEHVVIRAAPITRVARFLAAEDDDEDLEAQAIDLLDTEKMIWEVSEPIRQNRKAKPMVFRSAVSITRLIMDRLQNYANDPLIIEIRTNLDTRTQHPEFWRSNGQKQYQKHMTALIKREYRQASVVVCTPYTASTLDNVIKPNILWVDEAFRVTEPSSMIPIAIWPDLTLKALSGDAKQLPLVLTTNTHLSKSEEEYFLNPFAPQLEKTFASRLIESNAIAVHTLNKNYRCLGGVSKFASQAFYNGDMFEGRQVSDDPDDPLRINVSRHRQLLRGMTNDSAGGSSIMIDLQGQNEIRIGTSFANHVNARCAVDIVRTIFRSDMYAVAPTNNSEGQRAKIIIVSPYGAQVTNIKNRLSTLHSTEWVPELVQVRTGAGVQGSDCHICIIDLVRTEREGFLGDKRLGSPLTTRASIANIFLVNTKAWNNKFVHKRSPKIEWLRNLENYHIPRAAIAVYEEKKSPWEMHECHRCHTGHGTDSRCPTIECANCGGDHIPHHCLKPIRPLQAALPTGYAIRSIQSWNK